MRCVRLARRGHAVLVDGRRSAEQVQVELRQQLLLGPTQLWAAGRQGSHLALQAAAGCRRSFVLRGATEKELEAVGLEPRGEGDVRSAPCSCTLYK